MPRIFHHLGDSLLVQNGQKWRRSRKLLTPTFHFKVLRHYILETIEITSKMAEIFAARPVVRPFVVMSAHNNDDIVLSPAPPLPAPLPFSLALPRRKNTNSAFKVCSRMSQHHKERRHPPPPPHTLPGTVHLLILAS